MSAGVAQTDQSSSNGIKDALVKAAAGLVLAAITAIAAWAWGLHSANIEQDNHLTVHDSRLDSHDKDLSRAEKSLERIDGKLDRLLEMVRQK